MKQAKTYKEQDEKNQMTFEEQLKKNAKPWDIDCQAAKNHQDLDIASENQGAQQNGAHELEISYIMDRYKKTGILPELIKEEPQYGDFTKLPTFQEAHDIVQKAQFQFDSLDAHVRKRFANDPAQFLEFCNDEKNKEEMDKMGLLKPKQKPPEKTLETKKD